MSTQSYDGGDIDVRSVPDQGSTFTFTIAAPATPMPGSARPPDLQRLRAAFDGRRAPRCLIVEDNPVNRLVLARMLDTLAPGAVSVDGGRAALQACEDARYDIVLLDIQMPDVDGLEVARRLRALPGARPWVVAVTANALPEEERAARDAGVHDDIIKPRPSAARELQRRAAVGVVDVDADTRIGAAGVNGDGRRRPRRRRRHGGQRLRPPGQRVQRVHRVQRAHRERAGRHPGLRFETTCADVGQGGFRRDERSRASAHRRCRPVDDGRSAEERPRRAHQRPRAGDDGTPGLLLCSARA
jgi:CheY-like chemotaxis protein